MKITEQTQIGELLKAHPEAKKVLDRLKMGCAGCSGALAETIRMGARSHGIDPKKVVAALRKEIGPAR